ncbi:MAG: hypothetical protein M3R27_13045 [Bacteroidota bacterium]|nr:hypothetical protein [Bacteroidota bacterium]
MKNATTHFFKSLNSCLFLVFLFVSINSSNAQSTSMVQTGGKKYVRIDIGHGALHCPFLTPKFETQLKSISGIENFFIDKENSYTTFNLPEDTQLTMESLKKMGTDVGFPAADVFVKVDNKPIESGSVK